MSVQLQRRKELSLYCTRSKSKFPRVVHLSLAMLAPLALFITAFPTASRSLAATPEPQSQSTNPPQSPNADCPPDGQCFADVPSSSPFYTFTNRIYQQDLVTGYPCGGIGEPCDPESRPYYRPVNNITRQQMAKFIDNARRLPEIHIQTSSVSAPIFVSNTVGSAILARSDNVPALLGIATGNNGVGVRGDSTNWRGVYGSSVSDMGVYGISTYGAGVYGSSTITNTYGLFGNSSYGTGVVGSSSSGTGVYGISSSGPAGHFEGNVEVTGNLSKGGGSFKIDDPLDPANKYLYHSFVESPDMMNVYNGNVTLDGRGEATVQLPDWFGALNKDYRYQLTAVGAPGPNLYISKKVEANHFSIAGGTPGMEVSWQVTGIRQDPYANAHRIPVEEDKPANERGKYLHPTEWGQPESSGIGYEEQQRMQDMGQLATQSKP
jgi:hypothetical protein